MINDGTFAAACYSLNTSDELEEALRDGPDDSDLAEWGITEHEWYEQVGEALRALESEEYEQRRKTVK